MLGYCDYGAHGQGRQAQDLGQVHPAADGKELRKYDHHGNGTSIGLSTYNKLQKDFDDFYFSP